MPFDSSKTTDSAEQNAVTRFGHLRDRLCGLAVEDRYNPYKIFHWPDSLPQDVFWMSPALLSVTGTAAAAELTQEQLIRLSHWESINFYSLNVHGIRELLGPIVDRIHTREFQESSEFFHHFIGEENEHMWFFATFCQRYGGKIYPVVHLRTEKSDDPEVNNLLIFARILLLEELVDYFNMTMANDNSLPEIVCQVNRIHHRDESRHVAFGRELVHTLHVAVKRKVTSKTVREIETYLKRYAAFCLQSFYSPYAYQDAGIPDQFGFRQRVLKDPAREDFHRTVLRRPVGFMIKAGVFEDDKIEVA